MSSSLLTAATRALFAARMASNGSATGSPAGDGLMALLPLSLLALRFDRSMPPADLACRMRARTLLPRGLGLLAADPALQGEPAPSATAAAAAESVPAAGAAPGLLLALPADNDL